MKYLLLTPFLIYYIMRDLDTFIKQGELVRGLSIFILFFLFLLFFSAWLGEIKVRTHMRKKLGKNIYDWLEEGK